MTRKRNARFCKVCGQAFHGHGLWRTCPGCRAEKKVRKRMAKGWNLAPGVTPDDIDEAFAESDRTCGNCWHHVTADALGEACICMLQLSMRLNKAGAKLRMNEHTVLEMVEDSAFDESDTCSNWEEE